MQLCATACAGLLGVVLLGEDSGFLQSLSWELDIQWETSACQTVFKRSSKLCYFNAFIGFFVFFLSPQVCSRAQGPTKCMSDQWDSRKAGKTCPMDIDGGKSRGRVLGVT